MIQVIHALYALSFLHTGFHSINNLILGENLPLHLFHFGINLSIGRAITFSVRLIQQVVVVAAVFRRIRRYAQSVVLRPETRAKQWISVHFPHYPADRQRKHLEVLDHVRHRKAGCHLHNGAKTVDDITRRSLRALVALERTNGLRCQFLDILQQVCGSGKGIL